MEALFLLDCHFLFFDEKKVSKEKSRLYKNH